jgi:hypothetical protein
MRPSKCPWVGEAALQRPQTLFHPLAFDPAGDLAWLENGFVQHWDPVTGAVPVAPRSDEAVSPEEAVAFASLLLDAGARVDERDDLLRSMPLGWACRWGRLELVKLLIECGADAAEADAEPWATPKAWAAKMRRDDVLAVLAGYGQSKV